MRVLTPAASQPRQDSAPAEPRGCCGRSGSTAVGPLRTPQQPGSPCRLRLRTSRRAMMCGCRSLMWFRICSSGTTRMVGAWQAAQPWAEVEAPVAVALRRCFVPGGRHLAYFQCRVPVASPVSPSLMLLPPAMVPQPEPHLPLHILVDVLRREQQGRRQKAWAWRRGRRWLRQRRAQLLASSRLDGQHQQIGPPTSGPRGINLSARLAPVSLSRASRTQPKAPFDSSATCTGIDTHL